MSGPQRKALAELSKALETVIANGRIQTQGGLNNVKNWINGIPVVRTSVQAALNEKIQFGYSAMAKFPSTDQVTEKAKKKVGTLMMSYEELIGMKEVRTAHARVLVAEGKFIHSQEQRRLASKDLLEAQNRLTEIRAELDRSSRGDESYLDLIKKEFAVIKEERVLRSGFEELEREEREAFSELSNALRFSHERERAQNEKTKYWSIVGSIIGATLGILGTTINNRMKQNTMEQILGETATQVAAIQATVESLTEKLNEGSMTTVEVRRMVSTWMEQEVEFAKQRKEMTDSIEESVKKLKPLFTAMSVNHNDKFLKIVDEHPVEPNSPSSDLMSKIKGGKVHVSYGVFAILCLIAWKFGS